MSQLPPPSLPPVDNVREALRHGHPAVLARGGGRLGSVAVVAAAQAATPAMVNWMTRQARGLVSVALTRERCVELDMAVLGQSPRALHQHRFTVLIDAASGITTGISAQDRARAVTTVADPRCSAHDLVCPGHVCGIESAPRGVLERPSMADAAVDLVVLADCYPAALLCDVLDEDGSALAAERAGTYAACHCMPCATVDDVVRERRAREYGHASTVRTYSASVHASNGDAAGEAARLQLTPAPPRALGAQDRLLVPRFGRRH